ncbi:MAG: DUF1818 family protein [Cyanobium sp.]
MQEGEGWRLALDSSRHPFPVLIGGAGWAAELSAVEALALRWGIGRLLDQHRALAETLMADEAIELELELALESGGCLWLALEGDRRHWGLRFVLSPLAGGRGLEGAWGPAASEAFAAAVELASAIADLASSSLRSG